MVVLLSRQIYCCFTTLVFISLQGNGKQNRVKTGMHLNVYICVHKCVMHSGPFSSDLTGSLLFREQRKKA